jgi:ATP-dependent DNA ligase
LQHHRSKAEALLFYAFDILIYRGSSLLDIPLPGKREVLQKIFAGGISAPLMLPVNLEASPTDLVRALRELALKESSPSAKILFMSQASAAAHGSSARSTKDKNLS